MTEGDVLDLFIRAAKVDDRMPNAPKPARLKAQSLPFVHSSFERAGWEPSDFSNGSVISRKDGFGQDVPITEAQRRLLKKQSNDRLEFGDSGRLQIQADAFWKGERILPSQVTEWERALELMRSVSRERQRRCLWAYAKSRAKVLYVEQEVRFLVSPHDGKRSGKPYTVTDVVKQRMPFSKWCSDVEDVHRNYGKTCAMAAIQEITFKVFGKPLFTNEYVQSGTLHDSPVSGHIVDMMEDSAVRDDRLPTDGWIVKDVGKARRRFDKEIIHVPLSDLRKARRRQREAKRREQAA